MIQTIAEAIVELSKVGVMAYCVHFGGKALLLYVQRMPVQPTTENVIDAARARGYEVQACTLR
jgi:protein tyrosine phosphatase (PTP) superfamily phosphohydrolase (DUF442 family)